MAPVPAPPALETPPPSPACQNYHPDFEDAINHQINLELYASHMYRSMASYFEVNSAVLKQVSQFLLRQSTEQEEHTERLMQLQKQRGGHTRLKDISRPDQNQWESSLRAIECALRLAMRVNQNLLEIQQLASEKNDIHLSGFLEQNSLHEQVKAIQDLGNHFSNVLQLGAPDVSLAEHFFVKLNLDKKT